MTNNQILVNFFSFFKIKKNKRIIIYPNLSGFTLGIFVFFCFLISVFYENNFALLISIIIFFIFFISIIVSNQNLDNLNLISEDFYLISENEKNNLVFEIFNNSENNKLNIDVFYEKKFNGNYNFKSGTNTIKIEFVGEKRGIVNLDNIILKSVFPFGVINTRKKIRINKKIYIYPTPKNKYLDIFAEFYPNNSAYDQDDLDSLDQYKIGDNLSKIAWKKTLQKGEKFVKKFISQKNDNQKTLDLDKYLEFDFEELLSAVAHIFISNYQMNNEISLKHKDKIFQLSSHESSLNEILKYLSYVQK